MKNRLVIRLLCLSLCLSSSISVKCSEFKPLSNLSNVLEYEYYSDSPQGRFYAMAPEFVVFPDSEISPEGAEEFMFVSGLDSLISKFSGRVYIVNPVREDYGEDDVAVYKQLITDICVISNLKLIAIGRGADFLSSYIACLSDNVSGILAIDGGDEVAANLELQAKAPFITAHTDCFVSLKDIVLNAWDNLFSLYYRYSNKGHTWYTGARFGEYPYEFATYVMCDRMKLIQNVVEQDITGRGIKYLWYEYLPEEYLEMEMVPMVLLLHGHGNDPRTQAETSGFLDIASRERFIVVEAEWQGTFPSGEYSWMGAEGIESLVRHLLAKYPQIDPSRIYAEGLSAGAINATALGVRASQIFAAVGAQSAGVWDGNFFGIDASDLLQEAVQKRGHVQTAYFSIAGLKDEVVPFYTTEDWKSNSYFRAYQLYQTLNDVEVSSSPNMCCDSVFGIKLSSRKTFTSEHGHVFHMGDICSKHVPLMRLVAIEDFGHWNSAEATELMWDYFKHFSRNKSTGELIYTK